MRFPASVYARLLAKVVLDPTTGCWIWTGGLTNGYGSISINNVTHMAHRVVWEIVTDEDLPPRPACLDHDVCFDRRCVNPAHLRLTTIGDNVAQGSPRSGFRKTHCDHGHELAGANVHVDRHGHRVCRACRRRITREATRRRKETARDHVS